jgi:phospholipase/carboxylesterase
MSDEPQELDGPRFGPVAGGTPEQLIILLHGVGADGRDLLEVAPHWGQVLPNALFVAPNAPYRYDQGLSGYQWFSSGERVESKVLNGVQSVAPFVHRFIDSELAAASLSAAELALVGFSQGTMMSLYVALRRPEPVAGVLGYSGRLIGPDLLVDEIQCRPPVFLSHGGMDPLLPIQCMEAAEEALTAVEVPVQTLVRPDLGHGIDEEGLVQGTQFLRTIFGV